MVRSTAKQPTRPGEPSRRVLLVGWGGADWGQLDPLLDSGVMPALAGLVERGVRGRLAPVRPLLSPMLWTSAITGKRADKHGVCSFYQPLPDDTGLAPVSGHHRRCDAIWDRVTAVGGTSVVVGWPVTSEDEPIRGTIEHVYTAQDQPTCDVDAKTPAHQKELIKSASTDRAFAAAIGLVNQTHRRACELIEEPRWDFAAVYYPAAVSWSMGTTDESEPERRRQAAWRWQDALLGELIEKVGPETDIVLVSPHASPEREHTQGRLGMFCAAGPQLQSGKTHYGGTVLDVAPTVLRLLGLVEDQQTDGEPWLVCMKAASGAPSHRPPATSPRAESLSDKRQVDSRARPADRQMCQRVRENQRVHLALALSDSDRSEQAIALWRSLRAEHPDNETYTFRLIESLMREHQYEYCRQLIHKIEPALSAQPTIGLALAEIALAEQRHEESVEIAIALTADPASPLSVLARAAQVVAASGDSIAAEALYTRLIAAGGADAVTHTELAKLYWDQDRPEPSIQAARAALEIAPALSEARFTLARSLHRDGQTADAIIEFEQCLDEAYCPEQTHAYLASLYWANDPARAAYHRERAGIA